ncbi:MAG: hypothetical protein IPJ47_11395 [Anaerolineales bacterium]|nr:hypothetical protein [Anaerolineales bacterium]
MSLDRCQPGNQILFYEKAMGFKVHWREGNKAGPGAEARIFFNSLEELEPKRYQRTTGLYHFAILFPNRRELAIAMARLFALKVPNSPTDHVRTKTTYLNDPKATALSCIGISRRWFMDDQRRQLRSPLGRRDAGAMDAKRLMLMRFYSPQRR